MKKVLAFVLCIALLTVAFMSIVNAAVPGDDPQNQVNFAKGTAVIDGVKDDCYQAAGEIKAVFPGSEDLTNFATFSGYAVYDSEAVYLWGHISDATFSANSGDGGGSGWNGDSIEIFFNYNLEDGVGATDEQDPYGDTGCMQFRMIPLPIDALLDNAFGGKYENTSGHGLDDEITEDVNANPQNYLCIPDSDNKGYTIECRFPFPSAKKASVKSGLAIGFSIQINDAQEGTPTEDARRTGTIHSQYAEASDLIGSCWQWSGAMGRAFFTDAEYIAPVEAPPADVVDENAVGGGEENVHVDVATPSPVTAPVTGDSVYAIAAFMIAVTACVVINRKKIFVK